MKSQSVQQLLRESDLFQYHSQNFPSSTYDYWLSKSFDSVIMDCGLDWTLLLVVNVMSKISHLVHLDPARVFALS